MTVTKSYLETQLCVSGTLRAGVEVVNSGFSAGTWGPSTGGTVSEGLDFELLCASRSLFSLCRLASASPATRWEMGLPSALKVCNL